MPLNRICSERNTFLGTRFRESGMGVRMGNGEFRCITMTREKKEKDKKYIELMLNN